MNRSTPQPPHPHARKQGYIHVKVRAITVSKEVRRGWQGRGWGQGLTLGEPKEEVGEKFAKNQKLPKTDVRIFF
jgi:hypothetical protein